jgi:hypothetical protein
MDFERGETLAAWSRKEHKPRYLVNAAINDFSPIPIPRDVYIPAVILRLLLGLSSKTFLFSDNPRGLILPSRQIMSGISGWP